ncbi:MAG: hypothetical protein II336_17940 [Loktanella sp.]|nr:hypothetical protein [Loktanella sp.]
MTDALKPCPFCGGNLEVLGSPITRDIKKVQHPSANCLLSGQTWWHVPQFIDPWNTRATDSAELLEAAQVLGAVMQSEMTRTGGRAFTGIWHIPSLGVRTTCSEALDALDAAIAKVKSHD